MHSFETCRAYRNVGEMWNDRQGRRRGSEGQGPEYTRSASNESIWTSCHRNRAHDQPAPTKKVMDVYKASATFRENIMFKRFHRLRQEEQSLLLPIPLV